MEKTAVLFDLGNVLVRLRFDRGLARLAELVGNRSPLPPEATALFLSELSLACNRGDLAPADFLAAVATRLGHVGDPLALTDAWCDVFDPWPEMELLAQDVLDADHPTYLLSNTDPLHFAYLAPRMPLLGRMTGLHLSYEVGRIKPEPEYFSLALERFRLDVGRAVFIDDRPEHVEAARRLGIASHQHTGDVEEVRRFLCVHGVAIARPR